MFWISVCAWRCEHALCETVHVPCRNFHSFIHSFKKINDDDDDNDFGLQQRKEEEAEQEQTEEEEDHDFSQIIGRIDETE